MVVRGSGLAALGAVVELVHHSATLLFHQFFAGGGRQQTGTQSLHLLAIDFGQIGLSFGLIGFASAEIGRGVVGVQGDRLGKGGDRRRPFFLLAQQLAAHEIGFGTFGIELDGFVQIVEGPVKVELFDLDVGPDDEAMRILGGKRDGLVQIGNLRARSGAVPLGPFPGRSARAHPGDSPRPIR